MGLRKGFEGQFGVVDQDSRIKVNPTNPGAVWIPSTDHEFHLTDTSGYLFLVVKPRGGELDEGRVEETHFHVTGTSPRDDRITKHDIFDDEVENATLCDTRRTFQKPRVVRVLREKTVEARKRSLQTQPKDVESRARNRGQRLKNQRGYWRFPAARGPTRPINPWRPMALSDANRNLVTSLNECWRLIRDLRVTTPS